MIAMLRLIWSLTGASSLIPDIHKAWRYPSVTMPAVAGFVQAVFVFDPSLLSGLPIWAQWWIHFTLSATSAYGLRDRLTHHPTPGQIEDAQKADIEKIPIPLFLTALDELHRDGANADGSAVHFGVQDEPSAPRAPIPTPEKFTMSDPSSPATTGFLSYLENKAADVAKSYIAEKYGTKASTAAVKTMTDLIDIFQTKPTLTSAMGDLEDVFDVIADIDQGPAQPVAAAAPVPQPE